MEGALGLALHMSTVAAFGLASESDERLRAEADPHTLARANELHARHAAALAGELLDGDVALLCDVECQAVP